MQTYEDLINEFMRPWKRITRWKNMPNPKKEKVIEHTFKECVNTIFALALEKNNARSINKLRVLTAKFWHDVGEGIIGNDISRDIKRDKRLCDKKGRGVFDKIEKKKTIAYLKKMPVETKKFLKFSLQLIKELDHRTVEEKICDALEYYGYLNFAIAEIKNKNKKISGDAQISSANTTAFHNVIKNNTPDLLKYQKMFKFVEKFKEVIDKFQKTNFLVDDWLSETTLRRILDVLYDRDEGLAWLKFETNETLLERTMKTAALATFLLPQESSYGTRINGYKVLCTALLHKLDKVNFPVLPPDVKKDEELKKYEGSLRDIQVERLMPFILDCPQIMQDAILEAYLLERDRDSIEGRFFDAIKNLSCVLFAHHEWSRGKIEFREVFENCDAELSEYSKEFRSIRETYLPIKEDFERLAKDGSEYEKCLKRIDEQDKQIATLTQELERQATILKRQDQIIEMLETMKKEKKEMEKRLKKLEGKK